jgi:hypothetical protein
MYHILCVKFREKQIFLWDVQKDKKKSVAKRLILISNFVYIGHVENHFFFSKPLLGHGDVHTIFSLIFKIFSNILKIYFK